MATLLEAAGGKTTGLEIFEPSYGRMLAFGIDLGDLQDAAEGVGSVGGWVGRWQKAAEGFARLGNQSSEGRFRASARDFWLRACSTYHFAEFKLYDDERRKWRLQEQARVNYRKALSSFGFKAVRLEVPYRGGKLPGYFHSAGKGPAPCVVLINGLDSMKEVELHSFAQIFLERGISAFCFDGPGQGEAVNEFHLDSAFQQATSHVADHLERLPEVESGKLALFGVSFGGYLACRSAAADPRFGACISLGGFFNHRVFDNCAPTARKALIRAFGGEKALSDHLPELSLEPLRGLLDRPLLAIHGAQDSLVDYSQARAILDWADGDKKLVVFQDGEHVCTNRFSHCLPLMGDWLVSHLKKGGQDEPVWPSGASVE